MIIIFGLIILGLFLGIFLRKVNSIYLNRIITGIIWLLLFIMGIEVGSNPDVVNNLGKLGIDALLISLAASLGSIFTSYIMWRFIRKYERRVALIQPVGNSKKVSWREIRGSIIIMIFFILGCLMGYFGLLHINFESYPIDKYVLYLLMFFVGMSLGADSTFFIQLKTLNWRYAILPVSTVLGTLLGCFVLWFFLRTHTLPENLAVGSGLAYYSLSSILISDMIGPAIGTVALLANIFREIYALLFVPVVAKKFGPLSAISLAGATSYDTSLPVISQSVEKRYIIISIFHGAIIDLMVFILVPLFCSLA
ncbi:MAG: lysine exporter LysO family protein [Bacteroidales bacterium]